jgi:hypothetical protein
VQLTRIAGPDAAEVWVKLEAAKATGSYKDRMALAMIESAEREGRLRPGQTVVEYTGGRRATREEGHLVGPVDRREPGRSDRRGARAGAGAPGSHARSRLRTEVPGRPLYRQPT